MRALLPLTVALAALLGPVATLPARTVVEEHGPLRVEGTHIIGQTGEHVSLAGVSLFWSQWQGAFWNADCVDWLARDWNVTLIRASMGVEGGYLHNPAVEQARVERVVDAAIKAGIYVIIDWHDHHAEKHQAEAVRFFSAMAKKYGDTPNVIYEIFNEPLRVSWSNDVKPYAVAVVAAIRAVDPDNLVIVGTPRWCQAVEDAAKDPLPGKNLVYALHFYAGTHKQSLRGAAERALQAGLPLIVSEWGACNADGNGAIDRKSAAAWLDFIREHELSHCLWAMSDKAETSSIVRPGTSPRGGWSDDQLTEWGKLAREVIRGWNK